MRIVFVADKPDINRGSYRVWVNDLSASLTELGHSTVICDARSLRRYYVGAQVILFDKQSRHSLFLVPDNYIGLIGVINHGEAVEDRVDFAIVGSVEEQLSLPHHLTSFILPLIERRLEGMPQRTYSDHCELKIAYHGNELHLSAMISQGILRSIDRFSERLKYSDRHAKLVVISKTGGPTLPLRFATEVEYRKYEANRLPSLFEDVDIGIAPTSYVRRPLPFTSSIARLARRRDVHRDDYIVRFKDKSNYGRLLVYMQLGIAAIADLTPSHAQLLGLQSMGILATDEDSWFRAFCQLEVASKRQAIGQRAQAFSRIHFSSVKWADQLIQFLVELESVQVNKGRLA